MGATESIVLWPCFPLLDYPHHSQTCRPTRFAVVVATSAFAFRCSSHRRTCALPGRRARYRIVGIASSQRDSRFAAAALNAAQNFLSCVWTLSSGRSRSSTAARHRRACPRALERRGLLAVQANMRATCFARCCVRTGCSCVSGREFRIEALFSLCVFVCLCVVCVCFLGAAPCLAAFARCISLLFSGLSLCDGLAPGPPARP